MGDAAGGVSVDMKRVKARKDQVSGKSNTGVETWLKNMANCTVYEGHARFESPNEVAMGAVRLTAERIFINVGGRAVVPDIPRRETVPYLTNSSMMEVDFLPRHLIIQLYCMDPITAPMARARFAPRMYQRVRQKGPTPDVPFEKT